MQQAEYLARPNKDHPPPPWIPIFLRNWAPELIVGRRKWEAVSTRTSVADRLAMIERLSQVLADALDDAEVMHFLELPPHGRFESKLGTRIQIASLATRARDALKSPNLTTGSGEGRGGACVEAAKLLGMTHIPAISLKRIPVTLKHSLRA